LAGRLCNASGSRIFWLESFAIHLEIEYIGWKALRCFWKSNNLTGKLCDASGTPLKSLEVEYFEKNAMKCRWNVIEYVGIKRL
jgi:hypothetical protein